MTPGKSLITFNCHECGQAGDTCLDALAGLDEFACPNVACGHIFPLPATFAAEVTWVLNETSRELRRRQLGRGS